MPTKYLFVIAFLYTSISAAEVPVLRAEAINAPIVRPFDFAEAIAIPAAQNIRYAGRWIPPGGTSR